MGLDVKRNRKYKPMSIVQKCRSISGDIAEYLLSGMDEYPKVSTFRISVCIFDISQKFFEKIEKKVQQKRKSENSLLACTLLKSGPTRPLTPSSCDDTQG